MENTSKNTKKTSFFVEYYKRAIDNHNKGLKLVLGGTGLGKTSAIKEIVNDAKYNDKKFIYMAHRIQLIQEQLDEPELKGKTVYLRNDIDCLLDVNIEELESFWEDKIVKKYYCKKYESVNNESKNELKSLVKRSKASIESLQKDKDYVRKNQNDTSVYLKKNQIILPIKNIFFEAKKMHQLSSKDKLKSKDEKESEKLAYKNDFTYLCSLPLIQKLFPYIQFKYSSEARLLLVTIQKAFHGFFDGYKTVNLTRFTPSDSKDNKENDGYVVFLDEFDFLEPELVSNLCDDGEIKYIFEFVESFYKNLKKNKIPNGKYLIDKSLGIEKLYPKSPKDKEYQPKIDTTNNCISLNGQILWQGESKRNKYENLEKLEKEGWLKIVKDENHNTTRISLKRSIRHHVKSILTEIETLQSAEGAKQINYPKIIHFHQLQSTSKSIFSSATNLVHEPIYLKEEGGNRKNSFLLHNKKDDSSKSLFYLLDTVRTVAKKILRLLREIREEYPTLYDEFLQHAFGRTAYEEIRKQIGRIRQNITEKMKMLSCYEDFHNKGFSLYEVNQKPSPESDRNEVLFDYYAIQHSAEKILSKLVQHNLVFGLSATADIDRKLHNFDINGYLRKQEGVNIIPFDGEDMKDIQLANETKKGERLNNVALSKAYELPNDNEIVKRINEYYGGERYKDFNAKRINLFFSTLDWLIEKHKENPKAMMKEAQLLFFLTFNDIREFLAKYPKIEIHKKDNSKPIPKSVCEVIYDYKSAKANYNDKFSTVYDTLNYKGQEFRLVFYNSSLGKELKRNEELGNDYENVFWEDVPVIVITQYNSTSNGVNLQYYPTKKDKSQAKSGLRDFKGIHLLDAPYYYFSDKNVEHTHEQQRQSVKQNLYKLSKLHYSECLVDGELKWYLDNLGKGSIFNRRYLGTTPLNYDGILNQISVFIQAIGRIERVWNNMEDQDIRVRNEVYEVFEAFVSEYRFQDELEKLKKHCSYNMTRLLEEMQKKHQKTQIGIENKKEMHLTEINNECRRQIQQFVSINIEEYKKGNETYDDTREDWQLLRLIALKHDLRTALNEDNNVNQLKDKFRVTFKTQYFYADKIKCNKDNHIIPHKYWSKDFQDWTPNLLYLPVNGNEIVRKYFQKQGYKTEFINVGYYRTESNDWNDKGKYITLLFTPYFYQAILSGAIGEEAIKAIFEHEFGEGIITELDRPLFEVADWKIKDKPIYIDCKNYSENTVMNFPYEENDPLGNPRYKLSEDYFKNNAKKKWKKISEYHNSKDCKLIFPIFIGSTEMELGYYSETWKPVDTYQEAKIIVIPSVLDKNTNYNQYSQVFERFKDAFQRIIS